MFKLARVATVASKRCVDGPSPGVGCASDAECGSGGMCQVVSFLAVLATTRLTPAGVAVDVHVPQVADSQPSGFIRVPSSPNP